jgi:uncharacterized protein (DUF1778 family)
LRQAAEATERTLTDFILNSAVERAYKLLAERQWFAATEGQFAEFQRLLDTPLPSTARFDKLFSGSRQTTSE